MGKNAKIRAVEDETTKIKAVEDETAKRKAVEDESLLSTELIKQGMSSYGSDDNSDDDKSADVSFNPVLADMSHSKGDGQTTLTQYVKSIETPVHKKKIVQTKIVQITLSQFVIPIKIPGEKKRV